MCSILGEIFSIVRINLMHCNQARIFLSHYVLNVSWGFTKKTSLLPIVPKPIEVKEFCMHLFWMLYMYLQNLCIRLFCMFYAYLQEFCIRSLYLLLSMKLTHASIRSLNYSNWSTKHKHERNVAGNS